MSDTIHRECGSACGCCPECNGTGNANWELDDYLEHYPEAVSATSTPRTAVCGACGGTGRRPGSKDQARDRTPLTGH